MEWSQRTQIILNNEHSLQTAKLKWDRQSLCSYRYASSGETEASVRSIMEDSSSCSNKSISCVCQSLFNDDIEEALIRPLGKAECNNKRRSQRIEDTSNGRTPELKNMSKEVEIIKEGTELMNSINFPTVLVNVRSRKLLSWTLYYVILEPESSEHSGEIACMMLTSPTRISNSVQAAELLPLHEEASVPMLLNKRYKCIFSPGCSFKIKVIKHGRIIDRQTRKWKYYDREKRTIKELLRRLIHLDIKGMPVYMVRGLEPVHIAGENQRCTAIALEYVSDNGSSEFISGSLQNSSVSIENTSLLKLSPLRPNLRLRGVTPGAGSSFAKWLYVISPKVQVDDDFTCDKRTKLKKDPPVGTNEANKYLSISLVV